MIKVIVKDVNYDFTADDINYDEFKVYEGSEEDYIKEQKELLKEQLGTQFAYVFEDDVYNICKKADQFDLLEEVANMISDETGWLCEITDHVIIKDYTDDEEMEEILKERSNFKEFYVLHYNYKNDKGDYDTLNFKTWNEALKEFNETDPRNRDDMVEIIFSPEDENYSDNMQMIAKVIY